MLQKAEKWNALSSEQEKIVALTTQIQKLEDSNLCLSNTTTNKKTKDGKKGKDRKSNVKGKKGSKWKKLDKWRWKHASIKK